MKRFPLHLLLCLTVVGGLFAAGCGSRPAAGTQKREPWRGRTLMFEEAVAAINERNTLLPTLWARHEFEATVVDEKGGKHDVVGDGALLYRRPRGMLIRGTRPGMTLFDIGSTEDRYWLKLVPRADTMWWGKYEHLGKPCVNRELIPIRPDLVLEVLGVGTFDTNFTAVPVPTMRFNPDAHAYMFVWNARLAHRWWPQREIWYDRETLLPQLVILFDENGRPLLRAFLSKHEPVEVDGVPPERWPRVATDYRLFFPDTGTKMWIELRDMVLDKNGIAAGRGISFPNPRRAGVSNVIQVDEGCDDE